MNEKAKIVSYASRMGLHYCTNCEMEKDQHVNERCLFAPTTFKPMHADQYTAMVRRKGYRNEPGTY